MKTLIKSVFMERSRKRSSSFLTLLKMSVNFFEFVSIARLVDFATFTSRFIFIGCFYSPDSMSQTRLGISENTHKKKLIRVPLFRLTIFVWKSFPNNRSGSSKEDGKGLESLYELGLNRAFWAKLQLSVEILLSKQTIIQQEY